MDIEKTKLLFVFSNNTFKGMLTIGDIQRAILRNINLNERIINILDREKVYAHVGESIELIKRKMQELRAEAMPILDEHDNLIDIYFGRIYL